LILGIHGLLLGKEQLLNPLILVIDKVEIAKIKFYTQGE